MTNYEISRNNTTMDINDSQKILEWLMDMQENNKPIDCVPIKYTDKDGLIVNFGHDITGKLPGEHFDYTEDGAKTKLIYSVGTKISCYIDCVDAKNKEVILNRKKLQCDYMSSVLDHLSIGEVLNTTVLTVAPFGLFVDMGYGIPALLHNTLISEIPTSSKTVGLSVGDKLKVIYKGKNENGYIVSHKELLASWNDCVSDYSVGDVVIGKITSIETYGIFVEIDSMISGLAEMPKDNYFQVGDSVSVHIKNINIPYKKVKLSILRESCIPYKRRYKYINPDTNNNITSSVRTELKELGSEERHIFSGTFERYGTKSGYKGPTETVLLVNICDEEGNIVSDHLWFNKTKGFVNANMRKGDIVSFEARVTEYQKGYKGNKDDIPHDVSYDYKLTYPTKIKNLQQ